MAQAGGYREELETELKHTDPSSHASRLIAQEIDRLTKGEDEKKPPAPFLNLHLDRPQKISVKIRLPVQEHPRYNFVGKLLGPKGQTLKALQDQTGCKMAIMGRGSMREKEKEEQLRKEGGKYAHLNEDLHCLVECYTEMTDGYHRLAGALSELKKFVVPELQAEIFEGGDMGMNGAPPHAGGRGGFRGGPPERGGRGGFIGGRGNGPAPPGRGAPSGRGGPPPSRGAPPPRGSPAGRGAPPPRGGGRGAAPPPPASASYDGYGSQGYGSGYGGGYDDSYGQNYSSGAYDYGHGSSSGAGYDAYSSGYADYGEFADYGDSWGGSQAKSAPPSRGAARGQARSHPYTRTSSAGGGY